MTAKRHVDGHSAKGQGYWKTVLAFCENQFENNPGRSVSRSHGGEICLFVSFRSAFLWNTEAENRLGLWIRSQKSLERGRPVTAVPDQVQDVLIRRLGSKKGIQPM